MSGGKRDLDDADLDRGARILDLGVRELAQATAALGAVRPWDGANALSGPSLSFQVDLATGVARRATATAERQRITLRRHAALTRIAAREGSMRDFFIAIPFKQRPGQPKPPWWYNRLNDLFNRMKPGIDPATWGPVLAEIESLFKRKADSIAKDLERLRSPGSTGEPPKGIWNKVKHEVGDKWKALKKQISIIKASVKRAVATALKKLTFAISLGITVYGVFTAESDAEAARKAMQGAFAAVGGILGAFGGPGGAIAGAAAGDLIGEYLAKQVIKDPKPAPNPKPVPGV
jgi:hypothetical protein